MDDPMAVYVLQGLCYLCDIPGSSGLIEAFLWCFEKGLVEFSLLSELKDKVDGEFILEVVVELDYVGVVEGVHDLDLGTHVLHHLRTPDRLLLYLLYGVNRTRLLVPALPHRPIRSLTQRG